MTGDYLVREYRHEKQFPHQEKALQLLRKVASMVKPIMHQRRWTIACLCEMYPDDPNLLGLNYTRLKTVCLRLRHPHQIREFLSLEQVVDTMLHELCHYAFGPHDHNFHALWNKVRRDYAQLVQNGYAGDSSTAQVEHLGPNSVPIEAARRIARAAAARQRDAFPGPGHMPAMHPPPPGTHVGDFIASAVQNGGRVIRGCNHGPSGVDPFGGFRTMAEPDDMNRLAAMQAFMETAHQAEQGIPYLPPPIPYGVFDGQWHVPGAFPYGPYMYRSTGPNGDVGSPPPLSQCHDSVDVDDAGHEEGSGIKLAYGAANSDMPFRYGEDPIISAVQYVDDTGHDEGLEIEMAHSDMSFSYGEDPAIPVVQQDFEPELWLPDPCTFFRP